MNNVLKGINKAIKNELITPCCLICWINTGVILTNPVTLNIARNAFHNTRGHFKFSALRFCNVYLIENILIIYNKDKLNAVDSIFDIQFFALS